VGLKTCSGRLVGRGAARRTPFSFRMRLRGGQPALFGSCAMMAMPYCPNHRISPGVLSALVLFTWARAEASDSVLLITIDTLRADHLGCYGDARAVTPAIDSLAKQSVKFEHAFAAVPLTLPSHAALLTGTYPMYNGVRDQPGFRLPRDVPTLPELFSRAGYATAAVLGSPVLSRRFGLERGFDDYDDRFAASTEQQEAGLPSIKRPAGAVTDLALAWLQRRPRGKPFFLWLHFYDPHLPYRTPEPFRSRFASRPYDGEIAYTDSSLAKLFASLRRRQLFDSTIIVLTADHGEGLGDHGESTHGYFIYNSTLHVPLLIKPASPTRAKEMQVSVSLVDVAPTLLHLAGVPVPASMQGVDLAEDIVSGKEPPAHPVYAETLYPLLHLGWSPLRALISQAEASPRWEAVKYIQAPHPELYDLAADPGEVHNQYASQAGAAAHAQLEAFVKAHARADALAARAPVNAETAKLFASLGYFAEGVSGLGEAAARRDPKDGVAEHEALLRAAHAFQARRYDTAAAILEDVLRRDPQQPLALDFLGTIQFSRHDLQAARRTYAQLIEVAPYYATGYSELGHTETLLGNRAEAERLYRRAMEIDPSNPRPPRELGMLLLERGQLEEAEKLLREALKLDPTDVFALNALGEAEARQGDYQEAAAMLERALQGAPQAVPVRLNLGFVYLQLKRFGDVERLMTQTIRLDARQPQAYALLGAACLQLRKTEGAREAFQHALALDPHNGMALEGMRAVTDGTR
jgi:arylsulfatase A-like enzyme/Flp pilus assembly protein TadD